MGSAERVSAEIAELTILGAIASEARAGTWIDGRDKGIWIEPLHGARLRHARNCMVFIERYTRNYARELRAAAVDDAISIC